MKYFVLVFVMLTFFNMVLYGQKKDRIATVVIDAGHGGSDPGCLGKKSKEKDVNLSVALKLGELISANYDDVKLVYTRKTDVAVELYKRAQIANSHQADLFISIHCNAADNKSAHGVETYVMGLHKSEANLAVAKKENAAILKEDNYENNYDFNPNSPEADVIFSLYTSAYLKNSALFASKVQQQLVGNTRFADKGVKQAGFWVLYTVAMPSILVELGFLSNLEEESKMIKKETQEVMALSIYNAFVEYKNQIEGTRKSTLPVTIANTHHQSGDTPTPQVQEDPQASSVTMLPDDTLQAYFRVQFLASPENIPLTDPKLKSLAGVQKFKENNLWKYTVGNTNSFEEAQQLLKDLKKRYPDAFIVAFFKGEKIPVSKARELMKK